MLLALALPTTSQAIELFDRRVTINGFGTLGMAYNGDDDVEFIRDIAQPDGARNGWSADVDSRFGIQLGLRATSELDAVLQAVSRYSLDGNYDPQLTWAFLRYSPDPAIQLRVGRVGLDTYMLADSRDVGYSFLWVRPPVDYYGNRHLSHVDGADLVLKRPVGDGLLWGKLYAGSADEKISAGGDIEFDASDSDIFGGHIDYETGPWHFQLSYSKLRYRLDPPAGYEQYMHLLQYMYPDYARALREFMQTKDIQLASAGVAYDNGPLQVQTMAYAMNLPKDASDAYGGYVTVGYRLDNVTPYLTLSGARTEGSKYRDLGLPYDGEYGLTQHTISIGARYDFAPNMALKAQLDRVHPKQTGILLRSLDPNWRDELTIFSLALDFVF